VAILLVLPLGCSTAPQTTGAPDALSLDSLRAQNARLRAQNEDLRDSLQFREDLDTGQYYRDLRTLQDRLARLTYEVRLLRDGGLTVTVLSADSIFTSAGTNVVSGQGSQEEVRLELGTVGRSRHSRRSPPGGPHVAGSKPV
jgi:chemotaxis protein MotB